MECVVDRKIQTQQHLECKKRSREELSKQLTDLLFNRRETEDEENAELLHKEELHIQHCIRNQASKKRQKQKEVVMFMGRVTGMQSCLLPKVSIWYNHCVVFCSSIAYRSSLLHSRRFLLEIHGFNMYVESPSIENPRYRFSNAVFVCLTSASKTYIKCLKIALCLINGEKGRLMQCNNQQLLFPFLLCVSCDTLFVDGRWTISRRTAA